MASRWADEFEMQVTHPCPGCLDETPGREGECSRCRLSERADRDALSARLVAEGFAGEEGRA